MDLLFIGLIVGLTLLTWGAIALCQHLRAQP
jgi:hypothetical protein